MSDESAIKDAASIIARAAVDAADAKVEKAARAKSVTLQGQYLGADSEGKGWVLVNGAEEPTPIASSSVEADAGDTVSVSIGYGRAVIDSNISNPSAGAASVKRVSRKADVAQETAVQAIDYATQASSAAKDARARADDALESSASAQNSANRASMNAERAHAAADNAVADASRANQAAEYATSEAERAHGAADSAQSSADHANAYANSALDQLSVVQDVAGVLSWASEQGAFVETGDASIVDGKVYFTKDGDDYAPVVEPQESQLANYYELDMSGARQAMNEYILAHLAVTSRGLWVLPSGIGQAADEQHAPGYKMLLANGGAYIYDGSGALVRSDTADGTDFAEGKPFHFGSDDAYILYTPAHGSTPASLVIGGSGVQLGSGKTLSQWEAEMQQAVDGAAEAVQTALDAAHIVISSTNGLLFKNGSESTVLQAVVFPNGGDRCDTIAQLRERFGSGAYIEWRWKHEDSGEWGTLVNSDSHISQGGMWLTVTPEDVASKTSFSASLVVP